MSIIYDPKKRRPQVWTIILVLLIPIVIVTVVLSLGKDVKKEYIVEEEDLEVNVDEIFKKF